MMLVVECELNLLIELLHFRRGRHFTEVYFAVHLSSVVKITSVYGIRG